jgi:hypothetical protein
LVAELSSSAYGFFRGSPPQAHVDYLFIVESSVSEMISNVQMNLDSALFCLIALSPSLRGQLRLAAKPAPASRSCRAISIFWFSHDDTIFYIILQSGRGFFCSAARFDFLNFFPNVIALMPIRRQLSAPL